MPLFNYSVESLKRKTCLALMSSLWNEEHVIQNINNSIFSKSFQDFRNEAGNYIHGCIMRSSSIPHFIKLQLINCIKPMASQILNFIELTNYVKFGNENLKVNFIWSENGILDSRKTAEFIILNNTSFTDLLFSLSFVFYFEYIGKNIGSFSKESIFANLMSNSVYERAHTFVSTFRRDWITSGSSYFCSDLDGDTIFLSFKDIVLEHKSISLLKLYFENLSDEHKFHVLRYIINDIVTGTKAKDGVVLHYLLSIWEREQPDAAADFVKKYAYKVLSCFLDWPCLTVFLPVAKELWNSLSNVEYEFLTLDIAEYIHEYPFTYDYQNLFIQFWRNSPLRCKSYIFYKSMSGSFLSRLTILSNADIMVQTILESTTPENRLDKMNSFGGLNLCEYLVKEKRWESLKMLLLLCIPTNFLNDFMAKFEAYASSNKDEEFSVKKVQFCEKVKQWF